MKFHIDKTGESLLCRMCRVENDTVYSLYSLQFIKVYSLVKYVHWKLRKTWFSRSTTVERA